MTRITNTTQKELKKLFFTMKLRYDIPDFLFSESSHLSSKILLTNEQDKAIKYLLMKNLLVKKEDRYQLTEIGKFAYLMRKFKVSFLELCFLLETFCCEKRMKKICNDGFYLKYSFFEKVEDVVSFGTVSNTITNLSNKQLIFRHHKASYSVMPAVFLELIKFEKVIDSFHNWFIETWRRKNELILQDPLVIQRSAEFSEFYKKVIFH